MPSENARGSHSPSNGSYTRLSGGFGCRFALVLSVIFLLTTGVAAAGTPGAWVNDCSMDLDPGVCERVTYIAEQQPDMAHRLDLIWWGIWGLVGLTLVLLIAPRWQRAWEFWKGF